MVRQTEQRAVRLQVTAGQALVHSWFVRENVGAKPTWIVRPQGVAHAAYLTVDQSWLDFWYERLINQVDQIVVYWDQNRRITRYDLYPRAAS